MISLRISRTFLALLSLAPCTAANGAPAPEPIRLFILAGDELVLEQGLIDGTFDRLLDTPGALKDFEKNFRDLRRDLHAPQLPVVVAAIGWDGSHAAPVREAQLGITESVDRAAAIDTRLFLHGPEVSPGSRGDVYFQNAESFLGIGKAMGEKMLGLIRER